MTVNASWCIGQCDVLIRDPDQQLLASCCQTLQSPIYITNLTCTMLRSLIRITQAGSCGSGLLRPACAAAGVQLQLAASLTTTPAGRAGHELHKSIDESHISQVDMEEDQQEGVGAKADIRPQQEGSGPALDDMANTTGMYPGMGTSQLTPGEQEPTLGHVDASSISLDHIPGRDDALEETKYTSNNVTPSQHQKDAGVGDMPHRTNASPLGGPDQPPVGGSCYSG